MYLIGIEDRDYKEDKVECKYIFIQTNFISKIFFQGGRMSMDII
jgi:hypothetical protein